MRPRFHFVSLALLLVLGAASSACGDSRANDQANDALPQVEPPDSSGADAAAYDSTSPFVRTSDLRAGGGTVDMQARNPFADDPESPRDGRTLFIAMNCNGCHGTVGGGGIGPPLADAEWIYGGSRENIVQTLIQGRPNGMPSYGGRLPQRDMWKIAQYVQSLATSTPATTPSGR